MKTSKKPFLILPFAFLYGTALATQDKPADAPLLAPNASVETTREAKKPETAATKDKDGTKRPESNKDDNRMSVTSSTPVFIAAVKNGEAHGKLVGPATEKLKTHYKTESPLLIDAVVISKLDRKDCKLLSITVSQAGVTGPVSKKTEDMSNTAQLAICEDGSLYKPLPKKDKASTKNKPAKVKASVAPN